MSNRTIAALVVLNVVMVVTLLGVALAPRPAQAQLGGARGDYLMVSGEVKGRDRQQMVYILDVVGQRLIGLMYDSSRETKIEIDERNVGNDVSARRR